MSEQGSNFMEKEDVEMMTVQEVARLIEWLRAKGTSESEINDCVTFIDRSRSPTKRTDRDHKMIQLTMQREPAETWALFFFFV